VKEEFKERKAKKGEFLADFDKFMNASAAESSNEVY